VRVTFGLKARRVSLALAACGAVAAAGACHAQPADTGRGAGTHYFIEFRARPSTYIGHTFIVYGRLGANGAVVERRIAGLIPEVNALRGLIFPVHGSVREYKDDTRLPSRIAYRLRLSPSQYGRVAATVRKMQAVQHRWHAVFFNCNDFAIEIAEVLNLRRPPSLLPPDVWVASLRAMN
jgi:hypothetical protein